MLDRHNVHLGVPTQLEKTSDPANHWRTTLSQALKARPGGGVGGRSPTLLAYVEISPFLPCPAVQGGPSKLGEQKKNRDEEREKKAECATPGSADAGWSRGVAGGGAAKGG